MNTMYSRLSNNSQKLWRTFKEFDSKNKTNILDTQILKIFCKKKNEYKNREFILTNSFLFYKKDNKLNAYINLNFIGLNYSNIILTITLFNNTKFFTINFSDKKSYKFWWKVIKKVAIFNKIDKEFFGEEILGNGGNSEVFLLRKIKTNKNYAVKVLKKQNTNQKIDLLINEVNIMRKLKNKYFVNLYRVYEGKTNYYLIMDYCNNSNLNTFFNDKTIFKLKARIIKQLIKALLYLDSINLVHRDLKPENILLNKKNNKIYIKICDFGLSNFLDEKFILKRCGTPGYISPEILNYDKLSNYNISSKSDIYSFGHLFYNIITSKSIFNYNSQKEIIEKNKNNTFKLEENINKNLKSIIILCLKKNPLDRINIKNLKKLIYDYFDFN